MATRRTTRRSAVPLNDENGGVETSRLGAANRGLGAILKPGQQQSTSVVTRAKAGSSKSGLAEKDTNVTGVPKKRNALGDVTNNSKAASTSRGGVGGSKPAAKPTTTTAPAISRRTSRSRLRQDEDGDALMADSALPAAPPAQDASSSSRPIKALRSNARKPDDTKAPAASRRAGALTEKSNNRVAGGKSSRPTTATAKSKAERLAQLEETVRAAQAELERARREAEADDGVDSVEEEQHAAKRLRTSEPDRQASVADEDEDDYEVARRADEEDQARTAEKTRAKDEGWVDLDDGDEEDPLMVSTYVVEIYDYLRELELKTLPDSGYMERQEDLTFRMRAILMDWLVEVHGKFRLLPETIFLAQNLVDRFLSVRSVAISKFQLVGVTALFTAAKFEEVICPSVNNFMYMTDGGYEDDEILRAERHMLREVNFDLSYPNPINFLRRISKADGYDIQSRTFAKYFMEIAIVDETLYYVKPSLLAAAAVWLARKVLERGHWHANLVHYSGYAQEELLETAQKMYNYLQRNSGLSNGTVYKRSVDDVTETITGAEPLELEHPNFFKKYSARKFFKAATVARTWVEEILAPVCTSATDVRSRESVGRLSLRLVRTDVPLPEWSGEHESESDASESEAYSQSNGTNDSEFDNNDC